MTLLFSIKIAISVPSKVARPSVVGIAGVRGLWRKLLRGASGLILRRRDFGRHVRILRVWHSSPQAC
jgi:plasmid stabilization system protein ParE